MAFSHFGVGAARIAIGIEALKRYNSEWPSCGGRPRPSYPHFAILSACPCATQEKKKEAQPCTQGEFMPAF